MKPRVKASLSVVLVGVVGYAAACLALAYRAPRLLYHPIGRNDDVPVWIFQKDQLRIHVSHSAMERENAVLYFGGNAEDVSQSMAALQRAFPANSIHAMHYRSYGGSEGLPSEQDLVADALALYDALAPKYRHITLVGRSLGSGIAVQLAAARPSNHLVLITPYSSIAEIGQKQLPMFPVRWLLRDRYESWRYADRIHTPTTIIIAGKDKVIPNESSYRLAKHFPPGVARIVALKDADHSSAPELWHAHAPR